MEIANGPKPASDRIYQSGAIRAPYLSDDELNDLAARLVSAESISLPGFEPFAFHKRLKSNEKAILDVFKTIVQASDEDQMITPAAEWLLGNHYLVEENIRQVRRALPSRFYRDLPVMHNVVGGAIPRILVLAWLYVAHTHSTVAEASLSNFIERFQRVEVLEIGELWALPSAIRYVLIESLRRISVDLKRYRDMRVRANQLADRLAVLDADKSDIAALLQHYADEARDDSFAAQLLYRLRDGSKEAGHVIAWLESALETRQIHVEDVLVNEQYRQAADNVIIGNIIRSLRLIDDTDWTIWVEDISAVDAILRDCSNFADLDFQTRNRYRDRVEILARRTNLKETEVAEIAVEMANGSPDGSDIGFYFVGSRERELEQRIGYTRTAREWIYDGYSRLGWLGALFPMVLGTLFAVVVGVLILEEVPIPDVLLGTLLFLAAFPAMEAANGLCHWFASVLVKPALFPGFEWKAGIPREARTLVAVPCMLTSRDTIDELVRNLEVHYLSNPRGEIYFALIGDFADAATETRPDDDALLGYANRRINHLADRYHHDGGRRFFLLHRSRQFNESEGAWIGWERKRGKLHELSLLLRGDHDTSFISVMHPLPEDIRYVMTLDSDTRLTRDAVTRLVGKMHHPVNRPVVDLETGLVTSGYAILQPRVTPSLTIGAEASFFQRISSTGRGLDPYVFAVSDTYQDLFDQGTFTGKGLYDIDAFESAVAGRIPENAVLSHDLLEGSLARAGLATDVELIEDFPTRYAVDASRQHRWARGDRQLLPFILNLSSGIGGLGRFKMIDNLRRSLTPIFWVLASVVGWFTLPLDIAWQWQMALVLSLFVAPSMALLNNIFPARSDLVAKVHFGTVAADILLVLAQITMRITFIAHVAWLMADAIVRTLYRLVVSRQHLLEWRTAAQVERTTSGSMLFYYRLMWASPVLGVASAVIAGLMSGIYFLPILVLAVLWIEAPALAWLVSRSLQTEDSLNVSDADKVKLRRVGRRTWRYV